jgi:hypothetical protein
MTVSLLWSPLTASLNDLIRFGCRCCITDIRMIPNGFITKPGMNVLYPKLRTLTRSMIIVWQHFTPIRSHLQGKHNIKDSLIPT